MCGRAVDLVLQMENVGPAKCVLVSLANALNNKTRKCNPSQARLARETEKTEKTVQRHLTALEKEGLIKRETIALGFGKGSKTYFILPFADAKDAPENDKTRPLKNRDKTPQFTHLHTPKLRGVYKDKQETIQKRCAAAGVSLNRDPALTEGRDDLRDLSEADLDSLNAAASLLRALWFEAAGHPKADFYRTEIDRLAIEVVGASEASLLVGYRRDRDGFSDSLSRVLRKTKITIAVQKRGAI